LREIDESADTRPDDHAADMPDGPWAVHRMAVDKRIATRLATNGVVDIRDASLTRIEAIRGMGPASVAAFVDALPDRLEAIRTSGIHAPTVEAILSGSDPYAVPPAPEPAKTGRRKASSTRTKKPVVVSRKPAPETPASSPSEIDPARSGGRPPAESPPEADVVASDVADGSVTSPVSDAIAERPIPEAVLCAGEPYAVELSGGAVIVQSIGGNRMSVQCHDRYFLPHVAKACVEHEAVVDGRGWILDLGRYDRMMTWLRSDELSLRLRDENQVWNRVDPTHRTPRGSLHIRQFEMGGKGYIDVKSHPYEETMVRRLDLVCPALGGRWNPMKRCWSVHAHHQAALLRAMEPDQPPRERGRDEYAVPERTFRESGLEYASVFGNKPDLDWYEANGQIMLIDTPDGQVEIVRVDPETWIARKPNKGLPGVNAAITEACGTMFGNQGNWHPPFAGRRFSASDADEVIARLEGKTSRDTGTSAFPTGLF